MDEKVERSPVLGEGREDRIDRGDILDVAGQDERGAEALRERLDAFAERLALIGEGEFGALLWQAPCAMPQAIEWSLATPMMRPRLPCISRRGDVWLRHRYA